MTTTQNLRSVARAEARKLAQVRKLSAQLAYVNAAIAAGRTDAFLVTRAEQIEVQIAARLIGRCRECHQLLTDATSVAAGIGPECATKVTA